MFCTKVLILFFFILLVQGEMPFDDEPQATKKGVPFEAIGLILGNQMSQSLPPQTLSLWLANNSITKVRFYDSNYEAADKFAVQDIEVMIGIPNEELILLGIDDGKNANDWVETHVRSSNMSTTIKYVTIGNEPFTKAEIDNAWEVLVRIQNAVDKNNTGNIKATIPFSYDICNTPFGIPSQGDFRPDIKESIIRVLKYLQEQNAPFVVNIQPFMYLIENPDLKLDHAFFDNKETLAVDKGTAYTNIFDIIYDNIAWSLEKNGFPGLKLIVGGIGWPTDGDRYANTENAKRFYDGFLAKMARKEGTPFRPKLPIEAYIYTLIDENRQSVSRGNFQRHWGLMQYDGKPKFQMNISGNENNTLSPILYKKYLPARWCVVSREAVNASIDMNSTYDYACKHGDCSTLGYLYSCGFLNETEKLSYAYNNFFQMQGQRLDACDFDGTAEITLENPSRDNCSFPVQILTAGATKLAAKVGTVVFLYMLVFVLL